MLNPNILAGDKLVKISLLVRLVEAWLELAIIMLSLMNYLKVECQVKRVKRQELKKNQLNNSD